MARTKRVAPSSPPHVSVDDRRVERAEESDSPAAKPRPGRPRSVKKAAAKAIYFRDRAVVDKCEELLTGHPRASLSSVLQQMVGAFVGAYTKAPPTDHKLALTFDIYL